MDACAPPKRKLPWLGALGGLVFLAAILAVPLYRSSQWWNKGGTFGSAVGRYRVDNGVSGGFIGGRAGGLSPFNPGLPPPNPAQVIVHVGDTIDIHLDSGWGRVASSNPSAIREVGQFWGFLSGTVRFEAFDLGTAELTTTVNAPDCSGVMPPGSRSHTRCEVLTIAVFQTQ